MCSAHINQNDLVFMFINDSPSLIVDWSHKGGSRCILITLLKNYGYLNYNCENAGEITKLWRLYLAEHPVTVSKFLDEKYVRIKFVRNPYIRAVSSYLMAIKSGWLMAVSFRDFLIAIKENKWPREKYRLVLGHSRLQSKGTDAYMHFIIKIEDANGLKELNELLGLNLDINCYVTHHTHYDKNCDEYVGDKPLTKKVYCPYYCFYLPETLRLVEEIYGEDIRRFDYSCPQEIIDFIQGH